MNFDITVVGGGIVGLSTAWQLQRRYVGKKILLLEKERDLALHQSGRNSGVLHSGIYYEPGRLKASLCRKGLAETLSFCREHGIRFHQCGKILVAVDTTELARLDGLLERSRHNGVEAVRLGRDDLARLEPAITGLAAIRIGATAIVDFTAICRHLGREFLGQGGMIEMNTEVRSIRENTGFIEVGTPHGKRQTRFLVCCAGLQADRLAMRHGLDIDFRIVPFRGEYYRLAGRWSAMISHLIYPVPDPSLPFLGIHLTKTIDGGITVGPNAVLGFKREGYGRFNFSARDTAGLLSFPGFWRVARKYMDSGVHELVNSLSKNAYLREVRRYCPGVMADELLPHPCGVRAQAVLSNGTLVHDFLFAETPRALHVINAPSPAATSALPIGAYICDRIAGKVH